MSRFMQNQTETTATTATARVRRAATKPKTQPSSDMQNSGKHDAHLKRLSRIKGQLEGIERMLNDGRYCPEILQQVKSSRAALMGLECAILESHLRGCVRHALSEKDPIESNAKIDELIELMRRQ